MDDDANQNPAAPPVDQVNQLEDPRLIENEDEDHDDDDIGDGFADFGEGEVQGPIRVHENRDQLGLGNRNNVAPYARIAPMGQERNIAQMGIANNGVNGNVMANAPVVNGFNPNESNDNMMRFIDLQVNRHLQAEREGNIGQNGMVGYQCLTERNQDDVYYGMRLSQFVRELSTGEGNSLAFDVQNHPNWSRYRAELDARERLDGERVVLNRDPPQDNFLPMVPLIGENRFRVPAPAQNYGMNPAQLNYAANLLGIGNQQNGVNMGQNGALGNQNAQLNYAANFEFIGNQQNGAHVCTCGCGQVRQLGFNNAPGYTGALEAARAQAVQEFIRLGGLGRFGFNNAAGNTGALGVGAAPQAQRMFPLGGVGHYGFYDYNPSDEDLDKFRLAAGLPAQEIAPLPIAHPIDPIHVEQAQDHESDDENDEDSDDENDKQLQQEEMEQVGLGDAVDAEAVPAVQDMEQEEEEAGQIDLDNAAANGVAAVPPVQEEAQQGGPGQFDLNNAVGNVKAIAPLLPNVVQLFPIDEPAQNDEEMEQELFEARYHVRPAIKWHVHELERRIAFKKKVLDKKTDGCHVHEILNRQDQKTLKWYAYAERQELLRWYPAWAGSFTTRETMDETVARWFKMKNDPNYHERLLLRDKIMVKINSITAEENEEMRRRVHVEKKYPLSHEVDELIARIHRGEDLSQLLPRFEFSGKQYNRRIIKSILKGPISLFAMEEYARMIVERNKRNGLPLINRMRFDPDEYHSNKIYEKKRSGSLDHEVLQMMFVPLFFNDSRWILTVANFANKTIEHFDCGEKKNRSVAVLLYAVESVIKRQYEEIGEMFHLKEWIIRIRRDVPVFNDEDSGVFILQLAESIARGDEVLRPNIGNARKKIFAELGSEDKKLLF